MRRFLLWVFLCCTAASVALSVWPRQLDGYLALFGRHTVVNSGVGVTVLAVLTLLLAALRVRLWRTERDLARARRDQGQTTGPAYPPPPWGPPPWGPSPWGSRAPR